MSTQNEDKIDLDQERAAFEAHVRSECDIEGYADSILEKNAGGFYHTTRIQGAWEGWQGRAALSRKAQEPELTYTVDGMAMSQLEYIDYMHRQFAGERLRADQGWERAEAKSRECLGLRERMAAQEPAKETSHVPA